MRVEDVTINAMRALVGSTFRDINHDVTFELTAVDEYVTNDDRLVQFAVIFETSEESELRQGIRALDCEGDTTELFLVPVPPSESGRARLEAAFSSVHRPDVD